MEKTGKSQGPLQNLFYLRRPPASAPPHPMQLAAGALPGEVEGEVVITPYEDINALIIKASPKSYLTILETLKTRHPRKTGVDRGLDSRGLAYGHDKVRD